MADMAGHAGMDHGSMGGGSMGGGSMAGMDHSAMDHSKMNHSTTAATEKAAPFYAPGSGLTPRAADGGKFLSYDDLRAQKPRSPDRPATDRKGTRLNSSHLCASRIPSSS